MLAAAFFAPSPRPYIRMPQATEQYGQVLRVSVMRASLYCLTSAMAGKGAAPSNVRLDPASAVPVALKNCRRVILTIRTSRKVEIRFDYSETGFLCHYITISWLSKENNRFLKMPRPDPTPKTAGRARLPFRTNQELARV